MNCKKTGKSADRKPVLTACETFEDVLMRIIRNPDNGTVAHIAAECLFAVRKLENALTASSNSSAACKSVTGSSPVTGTTVSTPAPPAVEVRVIPPVDKEDL
ncbi:MAG: hypothetical protein ACYDA7_05270 [Acidithiobacillus sp.]